VAESVARVVVFPNYLAGIGFLYYFFKFFIYHLDLLIIRFRLATFNNTNIKNYLYLNQEMLKTYFLYYGRRKQA